MSARERIQAIQNFVTELKNRREEIVNVLMWEICKSAPDAAAEFDRTMVFIDACIEASIVNDEKSGAWKVVGGILAKVRRAAIGIMLCLGPFN
jgi:glyceraldehyde-3-phosphate dehydrogenase (NADP+)